MTLKLQISSNTYSTKPYYTTHEKQKSIEYSRHKGSIICLVSQKIFCLEVKIPEGQFRNILFFYFQKRKNAAWIIEKYVAFSYGDECMTIGVKNGLSVFVSKSEFTRSCRLVAKKVTDILKTFLIDWQILSRYIITKLYIDPKMFWIIYIRLDTKRCSIYFGSTWSKREK